MGCRVLLLVALLGGPVRASGPPADFVERLTGLETLNFANSKYYGAGGDSYQMMLDDLQRGHEGLIVKLNDVIRALKEDEVKLNNVFYKLGRHDTSLEGVDSLVHRLTDSSRRIEAKLNKHAFNVDFIRRRLEELQSQLAGEAELEVQVSAVRSIIDRLDDRLTDALARLGLVENTTKSLEKRNAPEYAGANYEAAESAPVLTVFPQPKRDTCRPDYERVGRDCYWFGGEELTFTEAAAACQGHGGSLVTLPYPGTQLHLLLQRLRKDALYWTSGTDAFSHGHWAYLLTAQPVMPLHWSNGTSSPMASPHPPSAKPHCAVVTTYGLYPKPCTQRHPYVCHVV